MSTMLMIVGAACVIFGAFGIHIGLGFIVLGALCIALGVAAEA